MQSIHAAADFILQYSDAASHWHKISNYIINLSVADEASLEVLSAKLRFNDVEFTEFREPDLDNSLTAVSFLSSEKTKKLTKNMQLLLKEIS